MKGGSKFKLKTGTIGKLPPKRPNLPAELFDMKALSGGGEEEEEEEEEEVEEVEKNEDNDDEECANITEMHVDPEESGASVSQERTSSGQQRREPAQEPKEQSHKHSRGEELPQRSCNNKAVATSCPGSKSQGDKEATAEPSPRKNGKKKVMGPSRPPVQLSGQYPEDDPDYCVWMPPAGQTGDGRTALNDKYGY
ncbi:Kanadaptin lung cancer oncogene 3 protein [Larimichthys crocea]|uniref:Kanadaptin lung cancer oncogene 3 protein n=1 Tax=Larimichthys crocea TaxID=215358 RepID=A0A6G0IEE7_LARCR|nr:Kanadaptin lung cancer oncogene 3 protein [Larimichthys crocea]